MQWVRSHVTANKVYCEYIAPSEAEILEHAQRGGFPANAVNRVTATIDPTSAE
ncbi:MAG TPA: nickel-binding protein [Xanthomonadaceae bacterium]|nr:nickel-binding protein [Xanthomonadaceae bacterium]